MTNSSDLLFLSRLEACYEALSPTEQKIADYMRENVERIPKESAQVIAENVGVGVASVMRFCKSCGYSGLTELKLSLKREDMAYERLADADVKAGDSVAVIKQKVVAYHARALENIAAAWNDEDLEKACDALLKAKKILITGAGSARSSALIMNDSLHLLNIPCQYCYDPVDEAFELSRMKKGDVMIGFSYSGRFRATLDVFKMARESGITTIGILGTIGYPISEYSDIVIYSYKSNKKLYFGTQGNTIGDFCTVELLYSILASKIKNLNDYTEEFSGVVERLRTE